MNELVKQVKHFIEEANSGEVASLSFRNGLPGEYYD